MSSAGGRRGVSWVGVAGLLVLLTACGNSSAPAAEQPYDGPLHETRDQATYPGAGAAGDVVRCRHFGSGGSRTRRSTVKVRPPTRPRPRSMSGRGEAAFEGAQDGLAVAARTQDRVLFVIEADGVPKQAVIVHDGPATEGAGGPGWYVESWARCDWSELPTSAVPALDVAVDRSPREARGHARGRRVCRDLRPTVGDLAPARTRHLLPRPEARVPAPTWTTPTPRTSCCPTTPWTPAGPATRTHLWLAADHRTAYVGAGPHRRRGVAGRVTPPGLRLTHLGRPAMMGP